jgi:hypothetical protein
MSNTPLTEKPIKRTIYTLVTDDYAPRIRMLTMPLMQNYARKIGAELVIITERKRPEWPVTIEKFQVAELAKARGDDWSMFIDADCLISPEFFDPTVHMNKAEVAHNGKDFNGMRWKMDPYLMRDGRWIGSCTWFVIASDWTVEDLWQLPTLTPDEVFGKFDEHGNVLVQPRINVTIQEYNGGACHREHLIDDYTLSRNIARFGLKFTTLLDICQKAGFRDPQGNGYNPFLWHIYSVTEEEKLSRMLTMLSTPLRQIIPNPATGQPLDMGWGLMDPAKANEFREEWKLVRR